MNNDITLIFQGKLGNEIINMIEENYNKYKIVIVTNDNNEEIKNKIKQYENIIFIDYKISIENKYNKLNSYYQFYSTYIGLCNVYTKYAIKFRGDEYFENIDPLVNHILSTDKIVCSDFLFRKQYLYLVKYNISDHYFGGKTDILLKSFKVLVEHCQDINKIIDGYSELSCPYIDCPEKKIAIAILRTLNVDISFNNILTTNIIDKYFDVYNSYNFNNFIYKCNGEKLMIKNNIYTNDYEYLSNITSVPVVVISDNNFIVTIDNSKKLIPICYRKCDINPNNKKVVFVLGDQSFIKNDYYDDINIILNYFNNVDITIYSNDTNDKIINNNITIENYNNFNSELDYDTIFILNNQGIELINSKLINCNNLFLLETNNICAYMCITKYFLFVSEYVDYIIQLNNDNIICNIYNYKYLNKNNFMYYLNIKIDDINCYV